MVGSLNGVKPNERVVKVLVTGCLSLLEDKQII